MKIAFFNDTYYPYVSGAIAAMDRFARSLKNRGDEVVMVVPGHPTPWWKEEPSDELHELPSFRVPGFDGLRIGTPLLAEGHFTVTGKLDRDIDIIHAHSPFIVGRVGARLAENRRIPLIFTCHSVYPKYSDYIPLVADLAADVIREYVADFCSACDVILAPSHHVEKTLRVWGVQTRIEVLPSGVDVDQITRVRREVMETEGIRDEMCRSLGIEDDSRVLLFVGRIDAQKNITFLFDVVRNLDRDTAVDLVVVGDGPARESMVGQATSLGVSDRVHFVGKKSFDEVVRWYSVSDVFCFPSTTETQGLVVVEAMAAGLPVVALSSPSSREIIENGRDGVLTRESTGEFADEVRKLIDDESWHGSVVARGEAKAEQFSMDYLTARLVGIYQSAIDDKAGERFAT